MSSFRKKTALPKRQSGFLCNLLAFPVKGHNHPAIGVHAGGIGGDAGNILQCRVDHMALIGVHGLQRDAAAVLDHLGRHLVGQPFQTLLPLGPVIFRVQLDTDPAAGAVDRVAGELLDGVQRLAPAADDGPKALSFQNDLIAALLDRKRLG